MTTHLRGRVRKIATVRRGRAVYEWAVINHTTGRVIASDNMACSLAYACDQAARLVDLYREVYIREIRPKHLRQEIP